MENENNKNKEYKYTEVEKEQFMNIYHSFMYRIMMGFNDVNNNISQVTVAGSGNIRHMDNSFKIIVDNFQNYDYISKIFDDIKNNRYSEELFKMISEIKEGNN